MTLTNEQIRQLLAVAYEDARKHKRTTLAQQEFEEDQEVNMAELYELLTTRRYKTLPAFCFITFDPVQREVFASQFRDRVVQHLLYNMLAPLFETLFIHDSYSCRVGFGTHYGVERYQHHLRSVTDNFRQEAFILMIDLSGYFMSIDRSLLMETVMCEVRKHLYHKSDDGRLWIERIDVEFCEWLMHCFLDKKPSDGCIYLGKPSNWIGLPYNKQLKYSDPGVGIVIGDNANAVAFCSQYGKDDECDDR